MKTSQFIERLAEALDAESTELAAETILDTLEGWDSLGHLATMAMMDELFGKTVSAMNLRRCRTVAELMDLACGEVTP